MSGTSWLAALGTSLLVLPACEHKARDPSPTSESREAKVPILRPRTPPGATPAAGVGRSAGRDPAKGSAAPPQPLAVSRSAQVGLSPTYVQKRRGTQCRIFDGYVVFTANATDSPGERIRVKPIAVGATAGAATLCQASSPPYAIEIQNGEARYLIGVLQGLLLVDEGTGAPRRLHVYDLKTRRWVFQDRYEGTVQHHRGPVVAYYQPLDPPERGPTLSPGENCKRYVSRLYDAVRKHHSPRFDRTKVPACPRQILEGCRNISFHGRWLVNLKTRKRIPMPQIKCWSDEG